MKVSRFQFLIGRVPNEYWLLFHSLQFAKSVFATRATFVAHGDLSSTPHMQQLMEGVSLR